ncbi:MAG: hypothetical protein FJX77_17245 [Armatimonadetes bacterium]|nr:hypothetical protein [Armatimonadota bacterium]
MAGAIHPDQGEIRFHTGGDPNGDRLPSDNPLGWAVDLNRNGNRLLGACLRHPCDRYRAAALRGGIGQAREGNGLRVRQFRAQRAGQEAGRQAQAGARHHRG